MRGPDPVTEISQNFRYNRFPPRHPLLPPRTLAVALGLLSKFWRRLASDCQAEFKSNVFRHISFEFELDRTQEPSKLQKSLAVQSAVRSPRVTSARGDNESRHYLNLDVLDPILDLGILPGPNGQCDGRETRVV